MAQTEKANTMAEIAQLAQIYGAKCKVWYFPKNPITKEIATEGTLKSINAKVAYSHLVKPTEERPLFFKLVKTQEQLNGNGFFNQPQVKIDKNSLSDPSLIELAAGDPAFLKAVKEFQKAQKQSETVTPETDGNA